MNSDSTIKIIIADDHDIYRDGLNMLISKDEEIEIIAEAGNGRRLIELVKQHKPDVVLTDLRMPDTNGIEAIKEIFNLGLCVRSIALSTFDSENLIVEALEAGAIGYIIKNAQRGEIIEAIKMVYEYHPYYCKSTSTKLIRAISKSNFNPYTKLSIDLFSEKEKQIIRLICQEKTSEEIGSVLYMGKRTVEGFRSKILNKMNVKTQAGLAIYAIKNFIYFID